MRKKMENLIFDDYIMHLEKVHDIVKKRGFDKLREFIIYGNLNGEIHVIEHENGEYSIYC